MNAGELPPLYSAAEVELRGKLRAARRLNAVAATVAVAFLEQIDQAMPDPESTEPVPVTMPRAMLMGVLAALGGETDPDKLHIDPQTGAARRAAIAHLLDAPLEDR